MLDVCRILKILTMYNRVGRTLSIIGQQFRGKLLKNTRNNSAISIVHPRSNSLFCASSNYVLRRNYCDSKNENAEKDEPASLKVDKDAADKLKEFLCIPENERLYKIIKLEIEVLIQHNERVPDILKPRHWWELVQLDSRSKRRRYLDFLWSLEKKKENRAILKAEKKKLSEENADEKSLYRLGQNTMFLRVYEKTINHMWQTRLINTMLYGQPIVLDCSYESYMTRRETQNCARQMKFTYAANRIHDNPFDMYLCNANKSGELLQTLHRYIPPMYDDDFPLHIKSESYLDIFDKNRLIYLTPHCQEQMTEFDHDAVYIIGAYVDKSTNEPVSLAKAKKEGLRMMKFPLDQHLRWGSSSGKNLTVNAVMNILLDLRFTGKWEEAFKHVPQRKLYHVQEEGRERKLQRMFESGELDGGEQTTMPLQESQFLPKGRLRFNEPKREYRQKPPTDFRSHYNPPSKLNIAKVMTDDYRDFSVKGRAKFRKNKKN